jgi:uncharacterized membrane protein (DUF4010 family)
MRPGRTHCACKGILFLVIKLAGRSSEGFIGDEAFTVVSAFVGALRRVSVLTD